MKRIFLTVIALLILTTSFGQKKELRAVEKALRKGEAASAQTMLNDMSSLIEDADDKYKAQYLFLRGKTYNDLSSHEEAVTALQELKAFEESKGMSKYSTEADTLLQTIAGDLVNAAIEDNQNKRYDAAAKKLYTAYQIDKEQQIYLYYAASSAVNAGDYDSALTYYTELKDLEYTGVATEYWAVNKETGEEENMGSKAQMDIMVKSGTYINPQERETESKYPEIVKNIALIYTQQGKNEEAIAAIKDARTVNPDDINLLLTEANLYIKLDDKAKFQELMEEAVEKDPNNSVLYFNLGVINGENGDSEKAQEYYQKAIDLDPKYQDAYMNMAASVLNGEVAVVEEMNSLGNSRADNLRYDELKGQREGLYRSAVPYLKKVMEIDPKNEDAARTLMNIYGTLGDNENFMLMKQKLESME